jgi:hypothetical protein
MKIKTLGLMLVVSAALGAVLAGSASATPVTKKSQWEIVTTPLTTAQAVKCSKSGLADFTIKGDLLGQSVDITIPMAECKEATISNAVVGGENMAVDAGRLRFTGVTMMEPSGCNVSAGEITTEPLVSKLEMDSASAGVIYDRFEPAAGASGNLFLLKITSCALAGSYQFKGVIYGQFLNATGVLAVNQPLGFNAATNALGSFTAGGSPATVTGEMNTELVSGSEFRATEK